MKLRIYILITIILTSAVVRAQNVSKKPVPRIYHSMVYHSGAHKIFLFGGHSKHSWNDDLRDVWEYDIKDKKWKLSGEYGACHDSVQEAQSACYDSESNVVIVLNTSGETWAFYAESRKWKHMLPENPPPARCGHMMTYDSHSDRIVLFGGFRCSKVDDPPMNDTWTYNYNSNKWMNMNPANYPPARMYACMVFNNNSNKVVLWGGRCLEPLTDNSLWEYDVRNNRWEQFIHHSQPDKSYAYPAGIYDSSSDVMYIFGGSILKSPFSGQQVNELWMYDFNTMFWEKIGLENLPPPVTIHSMVLNPKIREAIVFGGEINGMYSNELLQGTWKFNLQSFRWTKN
jgi:hypothetical protein